MITREQIKTALDSETKASYVSDNIDHDVVAISLLREKIPYDECKSIISGSGFDVIYLCDIEIAISHLTEEDLIILADCNCWIDINNDCLALFA